MKQEAIEFQTLLKFADRRHIVAVKFFHSEEDYSEVRAPELTHQLFYCLMVKAAAVGKLFKASKKNLYCPAAASALGFETSDENRRVYGLKMGPLELFDEEPDLVICICNAYVAMRIMQAYKFKRGVPKHLSFAGMSGFCTELSAASLANNDISFSLLCSNTRFSAAWNDDEMGISMPYDCFLDVLEGLWKTVDVYEPKSKKLEILERAKANGIECSFELDKNYYDSCLGAAKIGVTEYVSRKKH